MTITVQPCPVLIPVAKLTKFSKPIKKIVVHCSATKASQVTVDAATIHAMHLARKFVCIGYHYVITRNGTVQKGRPDDYIGAHVEGHNSDSLGICMVGGLDANGKAEDNYTEPQKLALKNLLAQLKVKHPNADICGHRDLSPDTNKNGKVDKWEWVKDCPCFDVRAWVAVNLK